MAPDGIDINARSRDLRPGLCVLGAESTASERPAISDGRGGHRASRGHGHGRGRGTDDHASIRDRGDGHVDDSRGDTDNGRSRIHRPAHSGAAPPRLAGGAQKSPAEVAATECQCGCRYLPGKPRPFREEPPQALLVFSYAKLDGNRSRLFEVFITFSNFLDE